MKILKNGIVVDLDIPQEPEEEHAPTIEERLDYLEKELIKQDTLIKGVVDNVRKLSLH